MKLGKHRDYILQQTTKFLKKLLETIENNKEEKGPKLTVYVTINSFIRNLITDAEERDRFPLSAVSE